MNETKKIIVLQFRVFCVKLVLYWSCSDNFRLKLILHVNKINYKGIQPCDYISVFVCIDKHMFMCMLLSFNSKIHG